LGSLVLFLWCGSGCSGVDGGTLPFLLHGSAR
jgi:hypothetical protein